MCGISGYFSHNNFFSKADLEKMTGAIAHRGPDSEGYFMDGKVGLGHKRLSILDLSERSNQPMHSHNERYVITFNGEIYNYREIAAKLKLNTETREPIVFKSSSDTEVILEAFSLYGPGFIHELNGMFAIAIYDKRLEELYLFRDRIGIKPLFYYRDGDNFAFASELKSLTLLDNIPKEINKSVIRDFLNLGYIPAPQSIYKHIKKVQAGHFIKVSRSGIEFQEYWGLKTKINNEVLTEEKRAIGTLAGLLTSAIQYQLTSDVPFGVFLSGGIDSSLITGISAKLSSVPINTFSIGFEEDKFSESQHAKTIAKYLGTIHNEFILSYKEAAVIFDTTFDTYDEPFADSSAIPTKLISKLAKQYVTVALSGEGSDELFFGYGAYKWSQRLHNPFIRMARKPIALAFSQLSNRYKRVSKLIDYPKIKNIKSHIFSQEFYLFSDNELDHLLKGEYNQQSLIDQTLFDQLINQDSKKQRNLNPMERQALFDIQYYLPDDLLTKIDRAGMQNSLEMRVPFLDHRIVEFALNLSPKLKYKKGINKYILKEILYQYIPEKYFSRPKQGFSIPLMTWLKNELKYLVDDYLSEEIINKYDIVNYKIVEKLKTDFFSGQEYLYNRLWLLIVLHKWLSKNQK